MKTRFGFACGALIALVAAATIGSAPAWAVRDAGGIDLLGGDDSVPQVYRGIKTASTYQTTLWGDAAWRVVNLKRAGKPVEGAEWDVSGRYARWHFLIRTQGYTRHQGNLGVFCQIGVTEWVLAKP